MVSVSDYPDISRDGSDATKESSSVPDFILTVSGDAGRRALHRFKLDKVTDPDFRALHITSNHVYLHVILELICNFAHTAAIGSARRVFYMCTSY